MSLSNHVIEVAIIMIISNTFETVWNKQVNEPPPGLTLDAQKDPASWSAKKTTRVETATLTVGVLRLDVCPGRSSLGKQSSA